MLLSVNIGNTNITLGIFKGRKLIKKYSVPTKSFSMEKVRSPLPAELPGAAVICSVVPAAARKLSAGLKKSGVPVFIIGKDIKVPLKNLYRSPKKLGADRLVNAYAGYMLYGVPLVVVDLGTAVTFDAVSRRGEYLGGMILPGLGLSLEALSSRTALLPRVKLRKPKEFIARDTKSGMLSGAFYGFGALISALSESIKKKTGKNTKVILTGGGAIQIASYCKGIDKVDSNLTLKGINLLYTKI